MSGFSETTFPRRLVASSYEVTRGDVDGDCGGRAAIDRLPGGGAYVLLIDYGMLVETDESSAERFRDRLPVTLRDGHLAEFECFGRSYGFYIRLRGRALQAHVGFGRYADAAARARAMHVLNSVEVVDRR